MMIATSTNSSQMRLLYRKAVWKNVDMGKLITDKILDKLHEKKLT